MTGPQPCPHFPHLMTHECSHCERARLIAESKAKTETARVARIADKEGVIS